MTSIGFAILDYFRQSLEIPCSRHSKLRPLLSERDTAILQNLYNWQEMSFPAEKDLAETFNLTAERIRQLRYRSLKRLRTSAQKRNTPILKIIQIIDRYAVKEDGGKLHKTIVRLWYSELPEFPAWKIIRLLADLRFNNKDDVKAAFQCLYSWKRAIRLERRRQLANKRHRIRNEAIAKSQLLNDVVWFDSVRHWKKDALKGKEPKRKVNHGNDHFAGDIFSQKCGRSIQYESGVELDFIKKLEAHPSVASYLEQPVTIEYNRNGLDYHYTPDFAILLEDGRCFIGEVKSGYEAMLDARVHRRLEALIEYCEKHGLGLLLTNGKYSLNYLFNYLCTPGLEIAIQEKLDQRGGRTIFFHECREILTHFRAKKIELLSLILKNNWGFYPYPFKLTPKSSYSIFRKKIIEKLPPLHIPSTPAGIY